MKLLFAFIFIAIGHSHAYGVMFHVSKADTNKSEKKGVNGQNYSIKQLQDDIDAILSAPELSNASVGISIIHPESGETFYKKNANTSLIPASTMKMF
ncbi:MAG: D-alanyl-D-alanine carboxypeptidase, partial [Candidatus Kapaibacteriota bacterium]